MSRETAKSSYYSMDINKVFEQIESKPTGLQQDAIQNRLEQYGLNEINKKERQSLWQKFINQFKDAMIIILLLAAILSIALEGASGFWDAVVILAVVLINAILGVVQENKAEEAIESLKKLSAPHAMVIRNGQDQEVGAAQLVPGDIVRLNAGDVVPADIRLFETSDLQIEEAALTGESLPANKTTDVIQPDAVLGDQSNMAFSSTHVTYGRALGVVTATGMASEIGKIASMLDKTEQKKTPLQENQDQLTHFLTIAIIAIAVIIFIIGGFFQSKPWISMLLTAISVAVAALPEGLPAIATIILALGTQKMAKRSALIRKLPAVETLGGTEIICSDKTGTLTQNQMTVEQLYYYGQLHSADEKTPEILLKIMSFANDAKRTEKDGFLGDPTEIALLQFAGKQKFPVNDYLMKQPQIKDIPFASERKMASSIHKNTDANITGSHVIYTKGAPDVLLKRCSKLATSEGVQPLTAETRQEILAANDKMASQALRVLALAYRYIDDSECKAEEERLENHLVFAGLVGEIDPERPEAKDAIAKAQAAGIDIIMITGDHQTTAAAIAKRLGILTADHSEKHVTTGEYLDQIDDETLENEVEQYAVYARVAPIHKVRIVKAWQAKKHNKVVAMTGDGVNDAPSLKQADIGIGMGITGTEVSKEAADMVLADDNFSTIVKAVEEGRKVFSNIQKSVQYLLSANLGEVLTLFIATFLGWTILEPVHILWINLVTDTFPAIALGVEEADDGLMAQKPRGRQTNLLSGGVLPSIIYQGLFEGGITLFVYWYAHHQMQVSQADAEAMAFLTLSFIQLVHSYNCRSIHQSLAHIGLWTNKYLNIGNLLSTILLLITVFFPGLNEIFGTHHLVGDPMALRMWTVIILASLSIIPYVELVKWWMRKSELGE